MYYPHLYCDSITVNIFDSSNNQTGGFSDYTFSETTVCDYKDGIKNADPSKITI
jgi:hypothetical protein